MKSSETSILFGPYGTRLHQLAQDRQFIYSKPTDLLGSPQVAQAVGDIVDEYLDAGASTVTVPCFFARTLLHEAQGESAYNALTERTLQIVLNRIQNRSAHIQKSIQILFSLGPKGDCYDHESAPDAEDSSEFHGRQIHWIDELSKRHSVPLTAQFETVPCLEEAEGIALALKKLQREKIDAIISYPFTAHGKALNGESFAEGIQRIDQHQNGLRITHGLNCGPIEGLHPALHESHKKAPKRIRLAYPNASSRPHSELNDAKVVHGLKDRQRTAAYLRYLAQEFGLSVIGGCCGYDHQDIQALHQCQEATEELPPTDLHPEELVKLRKVG